MQACLPPHHPEAPRYQLGAQTEPDVRTQPDVPTGQAKVRRHRPRPLPAVPHLPVGPHLPVRLLPVGLHLPVVRHLWPIRGEPKRPAWCLWRLRPGEPTNQNKEPRGVRSGCPALAKARGHRPQGLPPQPHHRHAPVHPQPPQYPLHPSDPRPAAPRHRRPVRPGPRPHGTPPGEPRALPPVQTHDRHHGKRQDEPPCRVGPPPAGWPLPGHAPREPPFPPPFGEGARADPHRPKAHCQPCPPCPPCQAWSAQPPSERPSLALLPERAAHRSPTSCHRRRPTRPPSPASGPACRCERPASARASS